MTRCPGCNRPVGDEQVVAVPSQVPAPSGSRWYKAGRADQMIEIVRRWHPDCLASTKERIAAQREASRITRRGLALRIAREDGLDVEACAAEFDAMNPVAS